MKLALVGVGDAGCRIVGRILDVERASGRDLSRGNTLLVNTSRTGFDAGGRVPEERQLSIGDVHRSVEENGAEGDPVLGAAIAREDRNEILRAFDLLEFYQIDGVLLAAGLGGGTGGGAGAVVLEELQTVCDKPVYALGVLPREAEGPRPALAAARSLQSFVSTADNVVLFDNEAWCDGEVSELPEAAGATDGQTEPTGSDDADDASDETAGTAQPSVESDDVALASVDYEATNVALATRVVALFAAGEIDGPTTAENRMDPSDIMRTLDTGGVSSIGYASLDVPSAGGLRSRLRSVPWLGERLARDADRTGANRTTDAARINRLVRQAAHSKLTLPCEISSADRALIMLSGPGRELSRKGFESGRYWLEEEADTVDVMAGDEPHDRASALTAAILFSNVTTVPRIDAMQALALEADDDGHRTAHLEEPFEYGDERSAPTGS